MAILLSYELETEERGRVTRIHYQPFHTIHGLPQEQIEAGVLLDNPPEPAEEQPYKSAFMYVNPLTSDVWYEYVDRELTQEEQMKDMETILDILVGGE